MNSLYSKWILSLATAALSLASAAGCEITEGVLYIDPPINVGDVGGGEEVEGPPHVELGFYNEQLYEPLADGDDCPVVWGLQGGTWTMPAIRIKGILSFATVDCEVITETDEVVGTVAAETRFFLATDGFLEVQAFPVPIHHAPPNEGEPIDDLYGLDATLTCTVDDGEGHSETSSIEVILVDG